MVSRILLGTSNRGKLEELRALFKGQCEVLGLDDLPGKAPEVIEDGTTYRANAEKKARAYFKFSGIPTVADDSGLEVDALDGAPGVYSARFGGEKLPWPERWQRLIDSCYAKAVEPWDCRFRCVLCFIDEADKPIFFEGTAEGRVVSQPVGDKGFGYDPVVWVNELGKTFAQASPEEKNRVSHRARAFQAFQGWLQK